MKGEESWIKIRIEAIQFIAFGNIFMTNYFIAKTRCAAWLENGQATDCADHYATVIVYNCIANYANNGVAYLVTKCAVT